MEQARPAPPTVSAPPPAAPAAGPAPAGLASYLRTLISLMRWRLALALGLMVLAGLAEGAGLLLLLPILQLAGVDAGPGAAGQVARVVAAGFALAGQRPTLPAVLALFVAVTAAVALLTRAQSTVSAGVQAAFGARLRTRLYHAIVHTDWLFFSRLRGADLSQLLTGEIDRVNQGTYQLLTLAATGTVTAVYLLLALQLSPVLTGLVALCAAGLLLLVRGKTGTARGAGARLSAAGGWLFTGAIEHLAAMKTAKSYGAEERMTALFAGAAGEVETVTVALLRDRAAARAWFDIGSVLILSLILYLALGVLGQPPGRVFLLLFLFARITPRFANLQQSYQQVAQMLPAFAAVTAMQARCAAAAEPAAGYAAALPLGTGVRLAGVSFAYAPGGHPLVLDGVDLAIPAGTTTAIVGPSGAGKSTVADLVLGLLAPGAGALLVDERPLPPAARGAWRAGIGYVAQDTFLFHDTVRANLLWACPAAGEADLQTALRLAAADFVARLPQGLDTLLGDRGVRLSGGERQRLALARALLRRPALLILDEATSHLDSENEARIQAAVERLHGRTTILVITHRLATIRGADRIYVLEEGRVVEAGSWPQLVAAGGRFAALCRAQQLDPPRPRGPLAEVLPGG